MQVLTPNETYVLNYCAKYLARDKTSPSRHNFGQYAAGDLRSRICEPWRFPIVDSYSDGANFETCYASNAVTFVYYQPDKPPPQKVSLVGTFTTLYDAIDLQQIQLQGEDTGYYAITVVVPKGEVHTYKFIVDREAVLDPVNPQQIKLDNGKIWSRFFTNLCSTPISFVAWEISILDRLTAHILPFETEEGRNFLDRFYDNLDRQAKDTQYAHAYRLDQHVGVANFIDKLVAKEENHHLTDYKICLSIIDKLLRNRNPYIEPSRMPKEMYIELYKQIADSDDNHKVADWDYSRFDNPKYFLQLLRRHVFTGAFSHPKYGGNVGAAAWAYLEEKYRDPATGKTLFDWRRVIEKPLGENVEYHG